MLNATLVLEGGSLRSLYTAGVLDCFMEKGLEFASVIGVSAGALTAANYVSKQKGRTAQMNILHSCDSDYYGMKQLFLKRRAFNFDYLFNDLNELYPYDMKRAANSKQKLFISATNCETGQVKYFESGDDYKQMTEFLRASSSLPLLSPMVKVNGAYYLDGGISDPIGIQKAFKEQYDKIVVILTRESDFVRKSENLVIKLLFRVYYRKYPALLNALYNMSQIYNEIRRKIDEMEVKGKIFVIRPQRLQKISRVEKNARKLIQLYFQGLQDAEDHLEEMGRYLHT